MTHIIDTTSTAPLIPFCFTTTPHDIHPEQGHGPHPSSRIPCGSSDDQPTKGLLASRRDMLFSVVRIPELARDPQIFALDMTGRQGLLYPLADFDLVPIVASTVEKPCSSRNGAS